MGYLQCFSITYLCGKSPIADTVADGGTINWHKHNLFDGLTEDEIPNLTLIQFEEHQREIMKRNALEVTGEVGYRIDGAPALGEFIDPRKSPQEDDQFFSVSSTYRTKTPTLLVLPTFRKCVTRMIVDILGRILYGVRRGLLFHRDRRTVFILSKLSLDKH